MRLVEHLLVRTNFNLIPKNSASDVREVLNEFRPYASGTPSIRIGPKSDGGYVLPDDLENIGLCLSPGCDLKFSFETELYKDYSIPSLVIDSTDKLPLTSTPGINTFPGWVDTVDETDRVTLQSLMRRAPEANSDLMLQMDIEGGEYWPLMTLSASELNRFRIIIVEFHGLRDCLSSRYFLALTQNVLRKLNASHYISHFHPNDSCKFFSVGTEFFPDVAEVTFHKKDRIDGLLHEREIPDALDFPNEENFSAGKFSFRFDYE